MACQGTPGTLTWPSQPTCLLLPLTGGMPFLQVTSLYESSFVGLQGLRAHFAHGSPEMEAAEGALMDALAAAVSGLKGVYGDDILYQVCVQREGCGRHTNVVARITCLVLLWKNFPV